MTASMATPRKLVIFAGGKGTRLSELTSSVPKPAIDVLGRPLVSYLCDWAFAAGLDTVIIAAGYKQRELKRRMVDYYELAGDVSIGSERVTFGESRIPPGCAIVVRDTGGEADTAERLYAVRDLLGADETFMVTYGDTLTDLDAKRLFAAAAQADRTITMCVGRPDGRYGEIVLSGGLVQSFREKERPQFYVNRGFFVVKRGIFDQWKADYLSFEKQVLPDFAARRDVSAHCEDCWFHSVDSLKDVEDLERHLAITKPFGVM
ncbi:MAG: sugar phosphate nucleotidyltransferase [Hyphomicrobiaceae bacterium]|nr:sugar phosphate nucleotidyltransferase [Hyphomicrobiaceae bacterium]